MNRKTRPSAHDETVTAESEQITGKFAIDLVLLDEALRR
jgi:hypothetical protein